MSGRENPIDGQYEFRLEPGVTIRGERAAVERVVCEIALHRRWKAKVQASLDMLDEQASYMLGEQAPLNMLDEQPPARPWDGAEIAVASFAACVLFGVLAAGWHIAAWLWSGQ